MMEKVEKAVKSTKFWIVGQASSESGNFRLIPSTFTDHVNWFNWCTSISDALKIQEEDTHNTMKIAKMLKALYPNDEFDLTFAMKVKLCEDDLVLADEIDPEILKS